MQAAVEFIANKLKEGKQAFIVCPSIVDAEGNDLLSIESFLRDFSNLFEDFPTCVIHGKLKNDEKAKAMEDFSSGKTKLLIATSVIEVGIDTKATEILIFERGQIRALVLASVARQSRKRRQRGKLHLTFVKQRRKRNDAP